MTKEREISLFPEKDENSAAELLLPHDPDSNKKKLTALLDLLLLGEAILRLSRGPLGTDP
jgi:hypothetical protein